MIYGLCDEIDMEYLFYAEKREKEKVFERDI